MFFFFNCGESFCSASTADRWTRQATKGIKVCIGYSPKMKDLFLVFLPCENVFPIFHLFRVCYRRRIRWFGRIMEKLIFLFILFSSRSCWMISSWESGIHRVEGWKKVIFADVATVKLSVVASQAHPKLFFLRVLDRERESSLDVRSRLEMI